MEKGAGAPGAPSGGAGGVEGAAPAPPRRSWGGSAPLTNPSVGTAAISAAATGCDNRGSAGTRGAAPSAGGPGTGLWGHSAGTLQRVRGGEDPLGNPFSCPAVCPLCRVAVPSKALPAGSRGWLRPEPRGLSWRQLRRLLMIDTDDGLHGLGREIIRPGRLRESHRLGEWRSGRRGRAVAPVSVCERVLVCVCVALPRGPDVSHGAGRVTRSWPCHTEPAVSHRARRGTRGPLSAAGGPRVVTSRGGRSSAPGTAPSGPGCDHGAPWARAGAGDLSQRDFLSAVAAVIP